MSQSEHEVKQIDGVRGSSDVEAQNEERPFKESDAGDGSRKEDQYLHGMKLVLCLLALFLCLFLVALDQTIVAVLLKVVGDKFNAFDKVGWLSSGFLLSIAVFAATWGKLSMIFGRKYTMLVAILIFEAGSLMCALAPTMNVLIGGRVFAGVGGGGIQTLVFILVSEIVPINKRPLSMSLVGCTFAVASVLGPLIGGALTSNVTWRWCFYINLPIGGVAAGLFFLVFNPPFPKGNLVQKLKLIDYFGVFLLTGGLVVFLLALTFGSGNEFGWDSGPVIACFIIGGCVMIIWLCYNFLLSKVPLIPREVVKVPQLDASGGQMFSMYAYFMGSVLYVTIYFQTIKDNDAWHSGLHTLPLIIPVVVASISGGILITKSRFVKPFGMTGSVLGLIGTGLICLLEVDSSSSKQIGLLIILGVSVGLQMQAPMIGSHIKAPKTPGGMILTTTFVNFSRALGGTLGADLADAVYLASSTNIIRSALKTANENIASELGSYDLKKLNSNSLLIEKLSPESQAFIKQQSMKALRNVYYMCIGFAALAFIFSIFTTNKRLPRQVEISRHESKLSGEEEQKVSEDANKEKKLDDLEKTSNYEV